MIPEDDREAFFNAAEVHGISEERAREFLAERSRKERRDTIGFRGFSLSSLDMSSTVESLMEALNPDAWADNLTLSELYDYYILHKTPDAPDNEDVTANVDGLIHSFKRLYPDLHHYLQMKKRDEFGRIIWDETAKDLGFIVDQVIPERRKRFAYFAQFFVDENLEPMPADRISAAAGKVKTSEQSAASHIQKLFPEH